MSIRTSQQLQQLFQKSKEEKEKQALEKQEIRKLKEKEYQREYRLKHREERRLYQTAYRLTERSLEYQKQYQATYRETHKEEAREYQQQYRNNDLLKPTGEETISQPPVKTKKQVKKIYQQWLDNLKNREPYLEGYKLYLNKLMQTSIEKELIMGRKKKTTPTEEIKVPVKTSFQRLEEKAKILMEQAQTVEEKKKIEEQLYYAKLRYKYSFI